MLPKVLGRDSLGSVSFFVVLALYGCPGTQPSQPTLNTNDFPFHGRLVPQFKTSQATTSSAPIWISSYDSFLPLWDSFVIKGMACRQQGDAIYNFNMCLGDNVSTDGTVWNLFYRGHCSQLPSSCCRDSASTDNRLVLPSRPAVGVYWCGGSDCTFRTDVPKYLFSQGCLQGGPNSVDDPALLSDVSNRTRITRTYSNAAAPQEIVPGALADPLFTRSQGVDGTWKLASSPGFTDFPATILRDAAIDTSGFNPDGTPTGRRTVPNPQQGEELSFRLLRPGLSEYKLFLQLQQQALNPHVDSERTTASVCGSQPPDRQCPCDSPDNSRMRSFCNLFPNQGTGITATEYRLVLHSATYPWSDRFSQHIRVSSVQAWQRDNSANIHDPGREVAFCFATEHKSLYRRQPYECNQFGQECKATIPAPANDLQRFFATPAFFLGEPGDSRFPESDARHEGNKTEWAIAFFADFKDPSGAVMLNSRDRPVDGPCPLPSLVVDPSTHLPAMPFSLAEDPGKRGFSQIWMTFGLVELER